MNKILFLIISFFFCNSVFSTQVPDPIEITPSNAEGLGFDLKITVNSSGSEVVLRFPQVINETWTAKRVQTYLFDKNKNQIMVSSSDYEVGEAPTLLSFYNPETNDLAISIQYFCKTENGIPCNGAKSYNIKSVASYLITSLGTAKN